MRARTMGFGLIAVVILAAVALVLLPRLLQPEQVTPQTYWPTQGWRTSTPEEQGLDSLKLAEGLQGLVELGTPIDSLTVIRNGSMLLDATFYPYNGTTVHKLASVTKSVMTTLIAIAANQGKLRLDQPMLEYFPDRTIANLDGRKEHITVRHLAGMANGFQSGCFDRDEQTLDAMRANPDWVQAALDRKVIHEPGSSFCYDSPGMHLLSAILQQATGMTALDFARQNLFEPLGIRNVVWESDPQGYSHGWGDLYLTPGDAAKIGYLWLNSGVWEGKQIVPAAWVEDSVKVQMEAVPDDYGYGWWVASDGYYATGRGGQNIRVYPSLNAVVVTTAGGLDYSQVGSFLGAALIDPDKPLPANPAGTAQLDQTLARISQSPPPQPVGPLPEIVRRVSGQMYVFQPNPAEVESLSLEFDDSSQAVMHVRRIGIDSILDWPIGLDGVYRLSSTGEALRGSWIDSQTFVFDLTIFGESYNRSYSLQFQGDRVVLSSSAEGISLEGQMENP